MGTPHYEDFRGGELTLILQLVVWLRMRVIKFYRHFPFPALALPSLFLSGLTVTVGPDDPVQQEPSAVKKALKPRRPGQEKFKTTVSWSERKVLTWK